MFMRKKNIIIIGGVFVAIAILGIVIFFTVVKNKDNKINNNNVQETSKDNANVDNQDLEVLTEIEKELGSSKPELKDFNVFVEGKLKIYLDNVLYEEETLNKIGTYKALIKVNNKEYASNIIVKDKEAPILKLKNVNIKFGSSYKLKDFVESCTDNSNKECSLAYTEEAMSKYTKVGTYNIEIKATDKSGNEKTAKTKLTINEDKIEEKPKDNNQSTNNNTANNNSTNNNITNSSNDNNARNDKITEASKMVNANSSQVNAVIVETNKIREELGLEPLTYSASLTKAAMYRALEISGGNFSHTRPDGSKFSTVFKELGISYSSVGENIAAGRSSAAVTVNDWKGSPGHYANMVETKFSQIGVGYVYVPGTQYKYYWVQLFSN